MKTMDKRENTNYAASPAVSVIVPVYKAEKYLHKCVDSLLAQTFTDFEVLLVDDGSPDRSGEICDGYAARDSRVRVFHKENGGVSSARNMGLDNARGEYIVFLDADDRLHHRTLDTCYLTAEKGKLDILQYTISIVPLEDSISEQVVKSGSSTCICGGKQYINTGKFLVCAGGCFLKRELIKSSPQIRFNENISLGEDQIFILSCILRATRCLKIADTLYFYTYNPESATHQADIKRKISEWGKLKYFLSSNPALAIPYKRMKMNITVILIKHSQLSFGEIMHIVGGIEPSIQSCSNRSEKIFSLLSIFGCRTAFRIMRILYKASR